MSDVVTQEMLVRFAPLDVEVHLWPPQKPSADPDENTLDDWCLSVRVSSRVRVGRRWFKTRSKPVRHSFGGEPPTRAEVMTHVQSIVGERHGFFAAEYRGLARLVVAPTDMWNFDLSALSAVAREDQP